MPELNDILAAFESSLALERELGTRVLDFDRSVLAPPKINTPEKKATAAENAGRRIVSPEQAKPSAPEVRESVPEKQLVRPAAPIAAEEKPPVPVFKEPIDIKAEDIAASGNSASPDFMFVLEVSNNQEAEELFRKMVSAMGYSDLSTAHILRLPALSQRDSVSDETSTRISKTVAEVKPKGIVLFGSSVTPYFFPGKLMRKGLTAFAEIPVMVTNSPVRILRSNTPNNAVKKETWAALKLILSKIGKAPPGGAR